MKRGWHIGNGWKRVKRNAGFRYFRHGKIVSGERFESAWKRLLAKRIRAREADTARIRRSLKLAPIKKSLPVRAPGAFTLCRLKGRQAFYDQIIEDRALLYKRISPEEFSALRHVVDIDPRSFKKSKKKRRGIREISERGHRSFRDLSKLKNFLGLNIKYNEDRSPDWSKEGVCQYEKRGYTTVRKLRGERIIGERILRRYTFLNA